VRKGSPFEAVRALPRIGPVAVWSDDEDWQDPQAAVNLFSRVKLPAGDPAKRHFGFGQNDARVLGVKLGADTLELTLNHYDIERLAACLVGWEERFRRAFPVTFRFTGVTELVLLRVVEQRVWQKLRASQTTLGQRLNDVIQLNCVLFEPGTRRFVLEFHGIGRFARGGPCAGHAHHCETAILVLAAALEVQERYREGWIEAFGGKHLDVLDASE
jgi:hypothetical protein